VEPRAGTKRKAGEQHTRTQGADSCDPGARTRTASSSARGGGVHRRSIHTLSVDYAGAFIVLKRDESPRMTGLIVARSMREGP